LPPCLTDCLRHCTGCHGSAQKSSGLDLEWRGLNARLKDVRAMHGELPPTLDNDCGADDLLINSNDAEASWLLRKVRGQQGDCGSAMPPTCGLDEEEVACIARFVSCVAALPP
jgi:hypothetical protein